MKSLEETLLDAISAVKAGRFEDAAAIAYSASILAMRRHALEQSRWTEEMQRLANQQLVHQ